MRLGGLAALISCMAAALAAPSPASAHAVLTGTEPARGAALNTAPERVVFRFSEAVEGEFGSVRVYDATGERVDNGKIERPTSSTVSIGLGANLADGPYTAAYRVISADSHPVSGGFVFTVGRSGGLTAASVSDVVDEASAGPVTSAAFGIARGTAYAATALLAGGMVFLALVWVPVRRRSMLTGSRWDSASEAFIAHARRLGVVAALTGVVACCLGIVLQAATAGGTSLWVALDAEPLGDVLGTRFGTVWSGRLVAFAALALALWLPLSRRARLIWAGGTVAFLAVAPALAGHPAAGDDPMLLVPANSVHVLAMSAWVGGIAMLLLVLPRATRTLEPPDRSRLLAATVAGFSTVALAAVALLVASGVLQSIFQLQALGDLTGSAFGRAVLVKSALVLALVAIGAHNRTRSRPQLERAASGAQPPGRTGLVLRRALRGEVTLMLAALAVTAALVSYSPTAGAAGGPFSAARNLGLARLELTVDPARVGANEMHVYLFDSSDGSQYDRPRRMTVTATLPSKDIGPVKLPTRKTGPGHYTVRGAQLVPAGDWDLEVRALVSAFDELRTEVEVPIR